MKKITSVFLIILLIFTTVFTVKSYATQPTMPELTTVDVQTSKTIVSSGEEVTVNINFGQELGAYTFKISYDDAIFEYVSAEGGTATDTSDKIIVLYYDSTGGLNPRTNMSVTFKAKSDITTSNPTEFTVVAEGLSNSDGSIIYDDITVPIVKNITVEPKYVPYTLDLNYTGEIYAEEAKEMKISYSSPMGHYYEHARLIATATTPEGGTVKLKGIDSNALEHDIIQSGWGDAQGYKIGGKDVLQVLNVEGTFSKIGNYNITLKLIDRDNSDAIIAQKTFDITVGEKLVQAPENSNTTNQTVGAVTNNTTNSVITNTANTTNTTNTTKTPTELPKTGINSYVITIIILISLVGVYVYKNKKK